MQTQVQDEIRDLQPDVIAERYLDAKYYQHSPDEIHDVSDCNPKATYLANCDQLIFAFSPVCQ